MTGPKTALVLAAGLGTRMRPLTNDRPKALIEVGGRALIDHVLDRLADAGVETAVVNVHAFADQMEAHLKGRAHPRVLISDERERLMDSAGGLKKARPLLGEEPIFVANIDSVWEEKSAGALQAMVDAWDPERMDDLLLLCPLEETLGFEGAGDFFMDAEGRLTHRGSSETAPYAFIGMQILKPQIVDNGPDEPFSIFPEWLKLSEQGRLHGVVLDGFWMHVGDPAAREAAEARLR